MEIITELKIENIPVKNEKLSKFASMLSKYNIDIYKYLPTKDAHKVSFVINDTSTFANFIRGTLWDGIPIWSLKIDPDRMSTNDPYILSDNLEQKIQAIRLNQSFLNKMFAKDGDAIYKNFKVSFSVENKTTSYRTVTSEDFKFEYEGKELKMSDMCSIIPIFELQPSKQLSADMTIERGYGFENANCFNPIASRQYKILDFPHITEGGPSSLTYTPRKIYMSYTTYRNFDDPLEIMHLLIDDNIDRILKFKKIIEQYHESKSGIYRDLNVQIIKYKTQTVYTSSESYFLSGALTRIIFDDTKFDALEFVTFDLKHILEHVSFIKIQAENANERLINACDILVNKLNEMKKILRSYRPIA